MFCFGRCVLKSKRLKQCEDVSVYRQKRRNLETVLHTEATSVKHPGFFNLKISIYFNLPLCLKL